MKLNYKKINIFSIFKRIFLRIKTADETAQCPLSAKYGAKIEDCPGLLQYALQLKLKVIGIR